MQINLFKATLSLRAGARLGCGLLRKLNRWNKRKRESRQTLLQQTPPPSSNLSLTIFSREKIKHNKASLSVNLQRFSNSFSYTNIFFLLSQSEMLYSNFLPNWRQPVKRTALIFVVIPCLAELTEAGARILFSFLRKSFIFIQAKCFLFVG